MRNVFILVIIFFVFFPPVAQSFQEFAGLLQEVETDRMMLVGYQLPPCRLCILSDPLIRRSKPHQDIRLQRLDHLDENELAQISYYLFCYDVETAPWDHYLFMFFGMLS